MADTVVTLGGDSSGLQDAFQDASKKAEALKDDAKKLTDQLKEVGDEADKAAGAFVQKFGGTAAIKAIAGVGTAVGLAKAGVEAFLDSSEALFRSYGEEGQKVWDETEKKLFAVKGAFAAAVLGGGDMEQQAARLSSLFTGVGTVMTTLLTPLSSLADAFYEVAFYETEATKANNAYAASKLRADQAAANNAAAAKADADRSRNLLIQAGKRAGLGQFAEAAQIQDEANSYVVEMKTQLGVARAKVAQAIANMPEFNPVGFVSPAKRRRLTQDMEAMIKSYGDDITNMAPGFTNLLERFGLGEMVPKLAIFQEAAREASNEADRVRVAAGKAKAEAENWEAPERPRMAPARAATPAKEPVEDYYKWVRETAAGTYEEITADQAAALQAEAEQRGDYSTQAYEVLASELASMGQLRADAFAAETQLMTEAEQRKEAIAKEAREKREADQAAEAARKAEFDRAEAAKAVALAEETARQEKEARAKMMADLYVLTVNNSAKMLAVDLQDKEKSKTAAQRATAAIVSGLGDMAMVKSGLAAAAGNFGEAAAFSAVGTLAYAAAAKLAPSEKSKTTAPAAAVNGPATFNTSYNLRVDAAFADGESVARRFAEMQQGAQRRGLI